MFYVKNINLSKQRGHDCYYCMDDNLERINEKFVGLLKKGITDIVIVSDDPNFIF